MEEEFIDIIKKIINNDHFAKLKHEEHHYVTNRYDHSLNVAYKTYKVAKFLNLNYVDITISALVHDFYFNDDFNNKRKSLLNHPKMALKNAKKIVYLDDKQENIISSHMFPIGKTLPKYKESVIVNLIDDYVSLKELGKGSMKYINTAVTFGLILLLNYIKLF